jgi:hypothetical protein
LEAEAVGVVKKAGKSTEDADGEKPSIGIACGSANHLPLYHGINALRRPRATTSPADMLHRTFQFMYFGGYPKVLAWAETR